MYAQRVITAVIILAVLTRIVAALVFGDNALPLSGAYDQVSYDTLAQRVLAGKGFSFPSPWYPFTAADEPTAHWSFLYTLYLAGIYALFGHHPLAARLIQVLLSGLQYWLTYRIGRRLFGEWAGIAAALLTAGYAYFIFFNAALMTQTFYILALLAALNIVLDLSNFKAPTSNNPEHGGDPAPLARQAAMAKYIALGVALGVAALMRQTVLLFTPVLFIWLSWAQRRNSKDFTPRTPRLIAFHSLPSALGLLTTVVVIAALILPWSIRNYLVYNDFLLLNSNSGYWFYSSNHPGQGTNFDPNYVAPIPAELEGLSEPAVDRALLREGIGFIVSDPARFVLLSISRTKDYFWFIPSDQSSLVSNVSRLLSFGLYLPFMVCGLFLSRKYWHACLPLYLYTAFDTSLCLISWSAPRYRLPTDALMMVFAGLAVAVLAERLHFSSWLLRRTAKLSGLTLK